MFADFNWIEFIKYILFALLGAAAVYYKNNPKLQGKVKEAENWREKLRGYAAEYIAKAEAAYQGTKRGGEKFEWVVTALYGLLPDAVTPFISRETVGDIVQGVFDSIESYAKRQADKLADRMSADMSEAEVEMRAMGVEVYAETDNAV